MRKPLLSCSNTRCNARPSALPTAFGAFSGENRRDSNESQLADLKQHLRPVLEKAGTAKALSLSGQLLAARLGLGSIDSADVRQKFLSST
jgi:hypothetical protein